MLGPSLSPNTQYDWNYTTTAQTGLNGRQIPYPRKNIQFLHMYPLNNSYAGGRVLGGTSSINYCIWNTGSKDDFDHYARVSGDNGWSWDSMKQYRLKAERFVPPTDGHDTVCIYTKFNLLSTHFFVDKSVQPKCSRY
jgi:choline dehydrogenase-like flavoprotein